ncbi:hypothetical protein PG993_000272 [Apiospora rasikravindrae]|uniref:Uncharacterized protein n=1 Tax=Apiospora rasikravindrae TaxID=990691 RepID=A0ABR1U840_9PEZI
MKTTTSPFHFAVHLRDALALVALLEVAHAVQVEPGDAVSKAVVSDVAREALPALAGDLGQGVPGLLLLELAGAVVEAVVHRHVRGAGPDRLVALVCRELAAAVAVALQVLLAGLQCMGRLVAGGEVHIEALVGFDASLGGKPGNPPLLGPDSVAGTVDFTRDHDARGRRQGQGEDGEDLCGIHFRAYPKMQDSASVKLPNIDDDAGDLRRESLPQSFDEGAGKQADDDNPSEADSV